MPPPESIRPGRQSNPHKHKTTLRFSGNIASIALSVHEDSASRWRRLKPDYPAPRRAMEGQSGIPLSVAHVENGTFNERP